MALSQALKLVDEQIKKYIRLQLDDFPYLNPMIRFDIFRHGIKKLQKEYCDKKLENLIERLCEDTKYLISLPFSMIYEIHKSGNEDCCKYTSRYDGDCYLTLTRLSSRGLDFLIDQPEEIIKQLNLKPEDYKISYKTVNGLRVNQKKVKSFPALIIDENNCERWVKEFRDKNKEEMEVK